MPQNKQFADIILGIIGIGIILIIALLFSIFPNFMRRYFLRIHSLPLLFMIGTALCYMLFKAGFAVSTLIQSPSKVASEPTLEFTITPSLDEPQATATLQFTPSPRRTTTPTPKTTAIPGWEKFQGRGVELWLPRNFEGGDPKKDPQLAAKRLRALGPQYAALADTVERNADAFILIAYDSRVGRSGILTNINIVTEQVSSDVTVDVYIDAAVGRLPTSYHLVDRKLISAKPYQVGRLITEFALKTTRLKSVQYVVKSDNTIWVVTYGTGMSEFDQRLPTFERSFSTFLVKP